MFTRVLIANRGEIAVRIARTLKTLGVESVAIYAEADKRSLHVSAADQAIYLGEGNVAETYLDAEKILSIAKAQHCDAIIPGYGFLSENASFARACIQAGIAFIGPTPEHIEMFGLKHTSRALCEKAGVPVTAGTDLITSLDDALQAAEAIGYPVMIKSSAGGGGIGLQRCNDAAALTEAFESTIRLSENYFSDGRVFLEKFVASARHIEVQIVGDGKGHVIALGERDCSVQRRNQKVLEETPAPALDAEVREAMLSAAVALGESVNYLSVGTVEFIYDVSANTFYFLEVNSRLQVEHPITELVTGVDLVAWMVQIAAGDIPRAVSERQAPLASGYAIEARVYAEEPLKAFQPSPGELTYVEFPQDESLRVDTWIETGSEVSAFYDPMIGKLIIKADSRLEGIKALSKVIAKIKIAGISTNLDYLRQLLNASWFNDARMTTTTLNEIEPLGRAIEVLKPGTYSSLQDFPGRKGYWNIGVPPSGPMDDYSSRLANRLLGNPAHTATLECTIVGAVLKFHKSTQICITGGTCAPTLNERQVAQWRVITVFPGDVLDMGKVTEGCRTYLAVKHGFDVPRYLGSRATFALGAFGGHGGRVLRAGDMLLMGDCYLPDYDCIASDSAKGALPAGLQPELPKPQRDASGAVVWHVGVMYGPHGAPDFFTQDSIDTFLKTEWEVHYNSNRLGIRLNGPKPTFTRTDGGEAGLHPSNIHDCEYAIGAINFTGDMPVILTHDGPSLGGFVCPVTIVQSELWKVGQFKPGDKIRFEVMSFDDALTQEKLRDAAINALASPVNLKRTPASIAPKANHESATVLTITPETDKSPQVIYRQAGDHYILIEFGDMALDLRYRFSVHALMDALEAQPIDGLLELSPGVRSLQVYYDSRVIGQSELMQRLVAIQQSLPPVDEMEVNTRIIHLPMAFEDSATLDAVDKYRQSVKDTAPWLPNNVDFIQRINGLATREAVKQTIFDASYLVLGLGDVYLGAPCAVPVDPRHRLLTSKYNPARTFTAEGTVGIGGVYMCIYGMDSPGGYQLVGRTLPIWNKYTKHPQFTKNEPWLLRFFDQVRYYEVSESELDRMRDQFREGRLRIDIEETTFSLKEHLSFLTREADSIEAFKTQQQAAFTEEVARWSSEDFVVTDHAKPQEIENDAVLGEPVSADIVGNIWKCEVAVGDTVVAGQTLAVVEAMKMEFAVVAETDGVIASVHCEVGQQIQPGQALFGVQETS